LVVSCTANLKLHNFLNSHGNLWFEKLYIDQINIVIIYKSQLCSLCMFQSCVHIVSLLGMKKRERLALDVRTGASVRTTAPHAYFTWGPVLLRVLRCFVSHAHSFSICTCTVSHAYRSRPIHTHVHIGGPSSCIRPLQHVLHHIYFRNI
jgi:hypothetical protein